MESLHTVQVRPKLVGVEARHERNGKVVDRDASLVLHLGVLLCVQVELGAQDLLAQLVQCTSKVLRGDGFGEDTEQVLRQPR